MSAAMPSPDNFDWRLATQAITVRVRWFGICIGYLLVNFVGEGVNRGFLNAILLLGAIYALLDSIWAIRGRVFLNDAPLFISFMEALFIGLLCYFDDGLLSGFRFYYFLSLLVCAIRYSPPVTWLTFVFHTVSYVSLALVRPVKNHDEIAALILMPIFIGWVTWACVSLSELLKWASIRLHDLNGKLQQNQALLELRINERTRQLQESQAMLVQQEKQAAFGLLAAGIAHEVGNPLAAISSLVQLINRKNIEPQMRERLSLVDDQLRRIQRTLRELVDFSRPAVYVKTLCNVHAMIDAALSIAKYYKRKKGKQIVTNYTDDLPLLMIVRDQLVQVFLNLILNAMDATPEGGTIQIRTSRDGDWLRIDIADDGHGIPESLRHRIFQPYVTTKETGTGLGLFVSRNIVEQNCGRIELSSTSTQGTTFSVFLDCRNAPSSASSDPAGAELESILEKQSDIARFEAPETGLEQNPPVS